MSYYNAERVDVCAGKAGGVFASVDCREMRLGSYSVPVSQSTLVGITDLGIKLMVPHVTDKSIQILNIQMKEIMKFIVHYGSNLPVIFLYTTPSCGRWIRKALGMGSLLQCQQKGGTQVLAPFYDPTNTVEQVRRIALVTKGLSDEVKTQIKLVFTRSMYDEISYRDATDLLQRSRGGSRDGGSVAVGSPATSGSGAPKRTSAIAASASIKKYAEHENTPLRGATRSGDASLTPLGGGGGSSSQSQGEDIHKLMIYPPQGKGGISINTEDYQCLAVDQYLNDVIIDFYLKYLHGVVMTPEQRDKTHIFSSFFYKRLTATSARQRHLERELKMSPAQKRHNRVKSWTKNVNLFEKDFIIIPINELSHWFLAVICFPGANGPRSMKTKQPVSLVKKETSQLTKQAVKDMEKRRSGLMSVTIGNTTITPVKREENIYVNEETLSERDEADGDESDMLTEDEDEEGEDGAKLSQEKKTVEPIEQPCILIFDSLRGTARSRVTATLKEYLACEYAAKKGAEAPKKVFDKNTMPGHNARVPQQNNFTDCGLFVLQYVEEMAKNPIRDFRLPMKHLKTWFNSQKVTRKREDIALLIRELLQKEHPERVSLLPEIDFPTVNGEPVEAETPTLPTAVVLMPEVTTRMDGDGDVDSEDLFDDIENTVVGENEAQMTEDEEQAVERPPGSEKKVTKLLIPSLNKRKSSMVDPAGSSGGAGGGGGGESGSVRKKAARIS